MTVRKSYSKYIFLDIRLDVFGGGVTLGTSTVLDSFHILGCTLCLIAALAIDAKGSAIIWEKSWNIQAGNPSGPPALKRFTFESVFSMASTVMLYSLGTSHCCYRNGLFSEMGSKGSLTDLKKTLMPSTSLFISPPYVFNCQLL